MRVLVLGAGFGGLELTTRLSDELGDAVEVMLIDKAEGFAFGFSRLDVMFGRLGVPGREGQVDPAHLVVPELHVDLAAAVVLHR